jgi:large subunit ribosomal protein L10
MTARHHGSANEGPFEDGLIEAAVHRRLTVAVCWAVSRRATLDTPLAPAFGQTEGMLAIAWGGEDVVDLAKELDRVAGIKDYEGLEFRGGALDGARLEPADVKSVAKWPSRAEQLSILSGQISSMGAKLSGQILGAGGTLAGQISSRIDDLEKAAPAEAPAA